MDACLSTSFSSNNAYGLCPSFMSHGQYNKRRSISCKATTLGRTGNLYKVLSLESENVGFEEIKKAYRAMALQYHPDVCPPSRKEDFTKMFVEVNNAYRTLSDPVLRKNYDYELSLSSLGTSCDGDWSMGLGKERWERQLCKLKKMSEGRMRRRGETSWGQRMRSSRK